MRGVVVSALVLVLGCAPASPTARTSPSAHPRGARQPPNGSGSGPAALARGRHTEQLLTVVSSAWQSVPATLRRYELSDGWRPVGTAIPVVLGENGLAWGRGLHAEPEAGDPIKHEGDGRSPAGVFALGTAFGYAAPSEAGWISMPYVQATDDLECVDDPDSPHYNQLVYRSAAAAVDWTSSEQMKRSSPAYRWGLFVEHNTRPVVGGRGSCIFLHVWGGPSKATVGCTAGEENQMKEVLRWLDPSKQPVLVQLPQAVYDAHKSDWALP